MIRAAAFAFWFLALLAGCDHDDSGYGSGQVWAQNESEDDVIVRHTWDEGGRRVWLVPANGKGVVANVNDGRVEALVPGSCDLLASLEINVFPHGVVIAADGTAEIVKDAPPPLPGYRPTFDETDECL